jgi:hypothetical protein
MMPFSLSMLASAVLVVRLFERRPSCWASS